MSQHLYECAVCHRYGVAHYILACGWLRLLCTKCWKDWKAGGGVETAYDPKRLLGAG